MNTCALCGIGFKEYLDYSEHIALSHHRKPVTEAIKALAEAYRVIPEAVVVRSSTPVKRWQDSRDNMSKEDKMRIVAKGEKRLGKKHFYGKFV